MMMSSQPQFKAYADLIGNSTGCKERRGTEQRIMKQRLRLLLLLRVAFRDINSKIIFSLFPQMTALKFPLREGGNTGLVITGEDSYSRGHGFESQHRRLHRWAFLSL